MPDNLPLTAEIEAIPCAECDVEVGPCYRNGHPSRISHASRIRAAVAARLEKKSDE
ncbi:hypothetical protein B7C42_01614 [Nocardia cerradoensis]|uniref:Uncharacterized protein n=1 Tax=Nocardia cerradoensis TaxID=85688 RepID=A0A231HCM0_9NOCA|nr:hypothetical protein [Nocardia cerradoensis]OXR46640.1 hypothetical protein B7C42_01614 [Nocardia cerradoensis]